MKHEILPNGCLKITCSDEDRANLRELLDERRPGRDIEAEALENLLANSELMWVDPADTGDLTSAPMLGILGEDGVKDITLFVENFGLFYLGSDGFNTHVAPIIARWAWMHYAVRSFVEELIEKGECVWEGGYAKTEKKETGMTFKEEDPHAVSFRIGADQREVLRLDETGMIYNGQRVEDAGAAHRAFMEVMGMMKQAKAAAWDKDHE